MEKSRKLINGSGIDLGVCYYPEHWDKSLWVRDLDRMLAVGLKTVRIAEFAWSLIEPREGEYTYEFFDGFLDLAEEKGMQVIFCTPTATPPAWLTRKYPEVLNADIEGNLYHHGSRRHYNYNSPVYREKSRNIVENPPPITDSTLQSWAGSWITSLTVRTTGSIPKATLWPSGFF